MLRALVGIEVVITAVEGKSKLSQNRSTDDIDGVAEGLEGIGRDALADRIRAVSVPVRRAGPRERRRVCAATLPRLVGSGRANSSGEPGSMTMLGSCPTAFADR
jgi:hypothetical protein